MATIRSFFYLFLSLILLCTPFFVYVNFVKVAELAPYRRPPFCKNMLENITDGVWVRKLDLITDSTSEEYRNMLEQEEFMDRELSEYRIAKGIHSRLWRDDLKCGSNNLQDELDGHYWGVGGWCDKMSDKPCCSDEESGTCGLECNCSRCIDMRSIRHAELSEWKLSDERCQWHNYTAKQACHVISRFSEIQFVGDSLVRAMARGLGILLRQDPFHGLLPVDFVPPENQICNGSRLYYFSCGFRGDGNYLSLIQDHQPLCGMDLSRFSTYFYSRTIHTKKFLELMQESAGKVGSVMIIGVGVWMKCSFQETTRKFLDPGFKYLSDFYKNQTSSTRKWPLIIFVTPDTSGVLKPTIHRPKNGNPVCDKFKNQMEEYCAKLGIPFLDIRKLTVGVHSYDGTHHGLGVNIMKVQLLLNYLDSISVGENWTSSLP